MTIRGLDHVQIAVPPGSEEIGRHFYATVLGLTEEPKPAPLQGRGGVWFRGPNVVLHLGADPHFTAQTKGHPAFLVDDLGDAAERLGSHGFPVRTDDSLEGVRRFYTEDPFGNRIELIQDGDGFSQHRP